MPHLQQRLPWNIIEKSLHTITGNTNPIILDYCKCGKIFMSEKNLDIISRHTYLENQMCGMQKCKLVGSKKFIRGINKNKIVYPERESNINIIGLEDEQIKYFYNKFMETIDDFAKTKKYPKLKKENIDIAFDENMKNKDNLFEKYETIDELLDVLNNGETFIKKDIIIRLLYDNDLLLLRHAVKKGVKYDEFYNLKIHQHAKEGIGAMILTLIEYYMKINMCIMTNKNMEEIKEIIKPKYDIYTSDYFIKPMCIKFKDMNTIYDLIQDNNKMSKYIFDILVNIRYLEHMTNNIEDWYEEFKYALRYIYGKSINTDEFFK